MVCKTVIRGFDSHLRLQCNQPQSFLNKWFGAFFLIERFLIQMHRNALDCVQYWQLTGNSEIPCGAKDVVILCY